MKKITKVKQEDCIKCSGTGTIIIKNMFGTMNGKFWCSNCDCLDSFHKKLN